MDPRRYSVSRVIAKWTREGLQTERVREGKQSGALRNVGAVWKPVTGWEGSRLMWKDLMASAGGKD